MAASQSSSAAALRQEVMSFRMVELQSVAERLGLRKTGEPCGQERDACVVFAACVPIGECGVNVFRCTH